MSATRPLKNIGLPGYRLLLHTIVNSGPGDETYGPRNILEGREAAPTLSGSFSEIDDIALDTLDALFAGTDIDILVAYVSLFSPEPSLTSRVVNRYKMREHIKTFNISGMGESIRSNWYCGKELSVILSNCQFPSCGFSMLLTNNGSANGKPVMKLDQLVRTHLGADDDAY
ncbi:unnamed protein product [Linum tenue]|uniref:FAE domain-containing protein n=1 Tax=Linum tenue TaxID=586396 RepID=A0AAV0JSC9_9ROSI|nr:unnamed protein product [Linum tenue]